MKPGDRVELRTADGQVLSGYLNSYSCGHYYDDPTLEVGILPDEMSFARGSRVPLGGPRTATPAKKSKPKKKETRMDNKYKVTIIPQPERKSVNIYVQVLHPKEPSEYEVYLTENEGHTAEVERPEGQEMPLYTTMPNELFNPLKRAIMTRYEDEE